jgi:hypothetical protein
VTTTLCDASAVAAITRSWAPLDRPCLRTAMRSCAWASATPTAYSRRGIEASTSSKNSWRLDRALPRDSSTPTLSSTNCDRRDCNVVVVDHMPAILLHTQKPIFDPSRYFV